MDNKESQPAAVDFQGYHGALQANLISQSPLTSIKPGQVSSQVSSSWFDAVDIEQAEKLPFQGLPIASDWQEGFGDDAHIGPCRAAGNGFRRCTEFSSWLGGYRHGFHSGYRQGVSEVVFRSSKLFYHTGGSSWPQPPGWMVIFHVTR